MKREGYDFSGWASKNDLKCSDGKIIRHGAFANQDGAKVPLFWNHEHGDVSKVLGHAYLENRDEGVYTYGYFNGTPGGKNAKECLMHGDIESISIWANNLNQEGPDVLHGVIREVSLVPAGANPGAFIESVVSHGQPMDDYDEEAIFYTGEPLILSHADTPTTETKEGKKEEPPKEEKKEDSKEDETVEDVINTMTEKQKNVMYALIADAAENGLDDSDDEEDDNEDNKEGAEMKHNVFSDSQGTESNVKYLSHSDEEKIFSDAKRLGSLREAVRQNVEDGVLVHTGIPDVPTKGMEQGKETDTTNYEHYGEYGFKGPHMFYPDYRALNNTPEFISRRMDWVGVVMNGVHRTPFSRVKSMYANITEEEARARGYIKKGSQKKLEVFKTLKRVINPTTIYKMQKLDRDDILDITDFDVVAWIRGEMRMMLDEEVARAILIGDGRDAVTEGKISEECILPISKDVDLFNVKVPIEWTAESTGADKAKLLIDSVIRAHKNYRGSGNPTMFTTEDWLTEMLLLEDRIGHKLYKTTQELATALRVSNIVTVEAMEGDEYRTQFGESKDSELIAVIVNLADYNVGQDRGGQVSMFDDFDIDYNQYKYLIETRMSGGLVKPFSAITVTGKQGE